MQSVVTCCFGWQVRKNVVGRSIKIAFSDNPGYYPIYCQTQQVIFLTVICNEESKAISMNFPYSVN